MNERDTSRKPIMQHLFLFVSYMRFLIIGYGAMESLYK